MSRSFGVAAVCAALLSSAFTASPAFAETVPEARLRYLTGDFSAVEEVFLPAAQAGHAQAMNLLADAYRLGRRVPQDTAKALEWYLKSATAGWPHAYANLGDIFADGEMGQAADPVRAEFILASGMKLDFDGAVAIEYAAMLRHAEPAFRDEARALRIVQDAAAMGKMRAIAELAFFYATGTLVETDYDKALALFKQAAEQGHPKSERNLGFMYDDGVGVAEDDRQALQYYLRASRSGDSEAMADAAFLLWFGSDGVKKDAERAITLGQQSAKMGHAKGYEFMADRMYFGEGVAEDRARAAEFYERAWEVDRRRYSGYALGWQLANGDGVDTDMDRAITLFRETAQMGQTDAAWEMGQLIHNNEADGTTEEMIAFLEQAAAADIAGAVNELGLVYDYGIRVPRDLPKALEYFERAAALGDPWAKRNVGLSLLEADTPPQADIDRAEALFKQAIDEGVASGWSSLAEMYEFGVGRPVDLETALKFYKRAGDAGETHGWIDAADMMLQHDPSPIDIVRAQGLYAKAAKVDPHAHQHIGDGWRTGAFGVVDLEKAQALYLQAFGEIQDADAAGRLAEMAVAGEGQFADGALQGQGLSYCLYAENRSDFEVDCVPLKQGLSPQDVAQAKARADAF